MKSNDHGQVDLYLNGKKVTFVGDLETPLLWVLREHFKLTGTKYGCGISVCGACTVHVNEEAVRSCGYPIRLLEEKNVVTIEGLSEDISHPVQQAWIEEDVPQCGYCQSGMIMTATALLDKYPSPTDDEINDNINNLCRCATYNRIRSAIHRASEIKLGGK